MNTVTKEDWVKGKDGIVSSSTHRLWVVPITQFARDSQEGMNEVVKWGASRCLPKIPFEASDSISKIFTCELLKELGLEWVVLVHASQTIECCEGLVHTVINTKSDGTVNIAELPHELLQDFRNVR